MDSVAQLPDSQRSELFSESAAKRGVFPAIIEKDFWVCWVLKKLFDDQELSESLVFKGGTSLSKVFGIIERFSEDIDLVLDWRLLGYDREGEDPWAKQPSATKQDRFNKEFNRRAQSYIADTLQPRVSQLLASVSTVETVVSDQDPQSLEIKYPAAFDLPALRPQVKLEIGPLASWVPSVRKSITPYAAIDFPKLFTDPECELVAITAERTFWEKATILHQQAHRSTPMPNGYSRHYYDLYQLSATDVCKAALSDLKLLEAVVEFKNRFYRCPWARYDLACPGSFRLLPTEQGGRELASDYRDMQDMIFGASPNWEVIISGLENLENEINSLHAPKRI